MRRMAANGCEVAASHLLSRGPALQRAADGASSVARGSVSVGHVDRPTDAPDRRAFCVDITRGSADGPFGNPFRLERNGGQRSEALAAFKQYLSAGGKLRSIARAHKLRVPPAAQPGGRPALLRALHGLAAQLRGGDSLHLLCRCAPGLRCHGHIIAAWLNAHTAEMTTSNGPPAPAGSAAPDADPGAADAVIGAPGSVSEAPPQEDKWSLCHRRLREHGLRALGHEEEIQDMLHRFTQQRDPVHLLRAVQARCDQVQAFATGPGGGAHTPLLELGAPPAPAATAPPPVIDVAEPVPPDYRRIALTPVAWRPRPDSDGGVQFLVYVPLLTHSIWGVVEQRNRQRRRKEDMVEQAAGWLPHLGVESVCFFHAGDVATHRVGDFDGATITITAPLNGLPPGAAVAGDSVTLSALSKEGVAADDTIGVWTTLGALLALGVTPALTARYRIAATAVAKVESCMWPTSAGPIFSRVGVRSETAVTRAASAPEPHAITLDQRLASAKSEAIRFRSLLESTTQETDGAEFAEFAHELAPHVNCEPGADLPPELLSYDLPAPPSDFLLRRFSHVAVVRSTEPLPPPEPQPTPPDGFWPNDIHDIVEEWALKEIEAWMEANREWHRRGGPSHGRPQPLALGIDSIKAPARGFVWDLRAGPGHIKLFDAALEPRRTCLDLEFAKTLFADCVDKEFVCMLVDGVRMKTEAMPHQIVLMPNLLSLYSENGGVEAAAAQMADMQREGFVGVFDSLPCIPFRAAPRGCVAKRDSKELRGIGDQGQPRKRLRTKRSGEEVPALNTLSREGDWHHQYMDNLESASLNGALLLAMGDLNGEAPIEIALDFSKYFHRMFYMALLIWQFGGVIPRAGGDALDIALEYVMTMGATASSQIAQRFSNNLLQQVYKRMHAAESARQNDPALRGEISDKLRAVLQQRGELEPSCYGSEAALWNLLCYCDDARLCCVGAARAVRLLRIFYEVIGPRGLRLPLSRMEKQQTGCGVIWLGAHLAAPLGLIWIPRDKAVKAVAALHTTLQGAMEVGEYRRLLGFLVSLLFMVGGDKRLLHHIFRPVKPGEEIDDGPATLVVVDQLMHPILERWASLILNVPGAAMLAAAAPAPPPPSTLRHRIRTDAALEGSEGGLGGWLYGLHFAVAIRELPGLELLDIPHLEFCAAALGTIIFAPMLSGAQIVELETDALATASSLTRRARRTTMQIILDALLETREFASLAPRLLCTHCAGAGNPLADAASRDYADTLTALSRALGVTSSRIPVSLAGWRFLRLVIARLQPLLGTNRQPHHAAAALAAAETPRDAVAEPPAAPPPGGSEAAADDLFYPPGPPPPSPPDSPAAPPGRPDPTIRPEMIGLGRSGACVSYDGAGPPSPNRPDPTICPEMVGLGRSGACVDYDGPGPPPPPRRAPPWRAPSAHAPPPPLAPSPSSGSTPKRRRVPYADHRSVRDPRPYPKPALGVRASGKPARSTGASGSAPPPASGSAPPSAKTTPEAKRTRTDASTRGGYDKEGRASTPRRRPLFKPDPGAAPAPAQPLRPGPDCGRRLVAVPAGGAADLPAPAPSGTRGPGGANMAALRAARAELKGELFDVLRNDNSCHAILADDDVLEWICDMSVQGDPEQAPITTQYQRASNWKHWEAYCAHLKLASPWRPPASSLDAVGQRRETAIWTGALMFIYGNMKPAKGKYLPAGPPHFGKPKPPSPLSALAALRGVRAEHVARGIEPPSLSLAAKRAHEQMLKYARELGPENCVPTRAIPMSHAHICSILSIPSGEPILKGGKSWDWDTPYGRSTRTLFHVLAQAGFRKAEVALGSGAKFDSTRISFASLSWLIDGKVVKHPKEEQLRGLKPGDYAILMPGPSKADCFGHRWGNNPIWLPFDPHAAINAAYALAEWELCALVAPEARRTTPLFCGPEGLGSSLRGPALDEIFFRMMAFILGDHALAKKYSLHGFRAYLASALLAAGCSDAQIQAALRWASREALQVYSVVQREEYGGWLIRAETVKLSGARASSLHAEGKHLPTYEAEQMLGDAMAFRDDLRRRAEHADLADERTIAALGVDGIVAADLDA